MGALLEYWSSFPPANELVAAYLGYKKAEVVAPSEVDEGQYMNQVPSADFDELLKQHGIPP